MGTDDPQFFHALLDQHTTEFVDRSACRDLIVVDQCTSMSTYLIPYQSAYRHFGIGYTFLVPGRNREIENFCKTRCGFRLPHVWRDQNPITDIQGCKVIPENK